MEKKIFGRVQSKNCLEWKQQEIWILTIAGLCFVGKWEEN